MKTIEEASNDYAQINDDKYCNVSKIFDKFDIAQAFQDGVEFAQRWISVEDELPEIGAEIVVKLKEHPLKKYQAWTIYCKRDIEVTPIFATHWRPIEIK